MLAALDKHLGKQSAIHWTHPHGGLYVWLTLPKSIDTSRQGPLYPRCLQTGVLYVPGVYCFHADPHTRRCPTNHIRLSFGQVPLQDIEPGIARLAAAIKHPLA
jgi:DNA-binding transcriptional MocR family regulator